MKNYEFVDKINVNTNSMSFFPIDGLCMYCLKADIDHAQHDTTRCGTEKRA